MLENKRSRERLTPDNAVFLPIDYMHGLMSACRSIDPGTLKNNAIALAKVAKLFGLPTFGTGDRSGRSYLGAEMPELEEIIPEMEFIPRSKVGAWDVPEYKEAVIRTGRKKAHHGRDHDRAMCYLHRRARDRRWLRGLCSSRRFGGARPASRARCYLPVDANGCDPDDLVATRGRITSRFCHASGRRFIEDLFRTSRSNAGARRQFQDRSKVLAKRS